MARDTSLWQRLTRPKGATVRTGNEATEAVRVIKESLQRLLNSRQGHAAAQMGYGIPDPSEVLHEYNDSIATMAKAIKASIERYEPRLTSVQVRRHEVSDDVLTLRFKIVAQLAKTKERIPVIFDTQVDSSGRIRVTG